jgi:RimJ/RimL family protein N-acetyltransferase
VPTDQELLKIEIETLWATDPRGRLVVDKGPGWQGRKAPHLVIAVSNDGKVAAIGSEVSDDLAVGLLAAVAEGPPSPPATPPASIARCEQLLSDSLGPVELSANPAYVIAADTAFKSTAEIFRSDGNTAEALHTRVPQRAGWSLAEELRTRVPQRAWSLDDWQLLLDGSFGPWAAAIITGQVIAFGHTARLTDRGAEVGVWTDPEFRGQGHAAAVTAAWASLLATTGRHLFYSTSADNLSSQRVTSRLGLRPIGWRWQLSPPRTV